MNDFIKIVVMNLTKPVARLKFSIRFNPSGAAYNVKNKCVSGAWNVKT